MDRFEAAGGVDRPCGRIAPEGVNQPTSVTPSEMLRLNTAIPATPYVQQNRLGLLGGLLGPAPQDLAGYPNGRRPNDDVVDISLVAVMGGLCVANGDHDVMVASSLSADLARRIPNAKLTIYPDSGHGGVFQYHREFVEEVLAFLES